MFDLQLDGPSATLRLARPEVRNAIARGGWAALARACAEAEAAGARLLVLRGDPAAFCAGADLEDFESLARDPEAVAAFRGAMRAGLDSLRSLPIATLALIEGACYGAGVALAMACDVRVAGPSARFAITPAKFGISYPQEDVARLVALVGAGQASRLLLGAGTIDAGEAGRIGLVEIVADDPVAVVEALAAAILANSQASIAVLKRGIRLAAEGREKDAGQDRDFDALFGSDELRARLAALRPGRLPDGGR